MPFTNFPHGLTSFGVPLVGGNGLFSGNYQAYFCDPTNGADGNDGLAPTSAVKTIARGYALLTANTNDTLFLIGSTAFASLAASLVWAKDYTHLVGVDAPVWMNQRARINAPANFTPGINVTGTGCSFRNIYFAYGNGNAGNLVAFQVTGGRNYFENVHFAGPLNATEAGTAGYSTLYLNGATECTFRNCSIGITTIARSAANTQILFAAGAGRTLFEDCNILSMCSATSPFMVSNATTGGIVDFVMFKNCQFLNFSANWATKLATAINNADGNSGAIIVQGGMFSGITAVGGSGKTLRTFIAAYDSTNAAALGLGVSP